MEVGGAEHSSVANTFQKSGRSRWLLYCRQERTCQRICKLVVYKNGL